VHGFRWLHERWAFQLGECDSRLPELNLQWLFLALVLLALVAVLSLVVDGKSHILVSLYAMTFLFGCCKTRRSVLFVLPSLYLPCAWWVLSGGKFDSVQVAGFGYLPGLQVATLFLSGMPGWRQSLSFFMTLAVFFGAVILGRPSSRGAALVGLNLFGATWVLGMLHTA
jgi:hypothetical protein